jgi:two-component system response regulator HydG
LLDYPWPGNVRELANAMDRAVALTRYDTVGVEDLPPHVRDHRPPVPYGAGDAAALVSLREMERRHIRRVLAAVGGNRSRAARILGLDRKTLYRKLRDDPKDAALPAGRATRPPPDSARGGGRTAPRRAHSRTRDPGGR